MENQLLHTPEGVRDIYNGECERKLEILARMNQAGRTGTAVSGWRKPRISST